MNGQFSLLFEKRFLPLFIVQFLGAFNDNFAKTVFVVLIAYGVWDIGSMKAEVLVSVAAGVFILPFILFTPFAGHLADRFDKARMIFLTKLAEMLVVLLAIGGLYLQSLPVGFMVLFALGLQSAFFSPCKFSILPQHLRGEELVAGNALVSSGTYVAILGGTMIGAFVAPLEWGLEAASCVMLAVAALGLWSSRFVPPARSVLVDDRGVSLNIVAHIVRVWGATFVQQKGVLAAIVSVGWFYFVAASFHAQFPNFTKQTLGADTAVLSGFMALFSVGVVVGGLANYYLLKGRPCGRFVPFAAFAMAGFGVDLYFASHSFVRLDGVALYDIVAFVAMTQSWRVIADVFFIAVFAGVYVIPLRAIMQQRTGADVRGQVMASSNMMDAALILCSAALAALVFSFGGAVEGLYGIVSVLTVLVAILLFNNRSLRDNTGA